MSVTAQVVLDDVEGPAVAERAAIEVFVGGAVDQGKQAVVERVWIAAVALGQLQAAPCCGPPQAVLADFDFILRHGLYPRFDARRYTRREANRSRSIRPSCCSA